MKSTKTLAMTAKEEVLILIVMEDTHEEFVQDFMEWCKSRLNPYCNGRYS